MFSTTIIIIVSKSSIIVVLAVIIDDDVQPVHYSYNIDTLNQDGCNIDCCWIKDPHVDL